MEKELPPEHRCVKDSFEALLHRCSLTATDLVSLGLPEPPPPGRLQQAPGASDAGQLPPDGDLQEQDTGCVT